MAGLCFSAEKRKRHSLINVKVHTAFHGVHAGRPVLLGHIANPEKPSLLKGNTLQSPPRLFMLSERLRWEELGVVGDLPVA